MAPKKKSDMSEPRPVSTKKPSSFYLGRSSVISEALDAWAGGDLQWFERSCAEAPGAKETTPCIRAGYAVVSQKFFEVGLRFPYSRFVGDVPALFGPEIHQILQTH